MVFEHYVVDHVGVSLVCHGLLANIVVPLLCFCSTRAALLCSAFTGRTDCTDAPFDCVGYLALGSSTREYKVCMALGIFLFVRGGGPNR